MAEYTPVFRTCEDCQESFNSSAHVPVCASCAKGRERERWRVAREKTDDLWVEVLCVWCGAQRQVRYRNQARDRFRGCSRSCTEAAMAFVDNHGLLFSNVRRDPPTYNGPIRRCEWCNQGPLTKKWCDDYCAERGNGRRLDATRVWRRECDWCHSGFWGRSASAFFCSRRCSRNSKRPDRGWDRHRSVVYERDSYVCWLCGDECDPSDFIVKDGHYIAGPTHPSLDHVVKRAYGGPDEPENLRTAHTSCNTAREVDAQLAWC